MTRRTRLAAALLAATPVALAASILAEAPLSLDVVPVVMLAGFAVTYGALAAGVWRALAPARWIGLGLALSMTILGIAYSEWIVVALHAPLPLLLARPDDAHPRTALTWLSVGFALVPVILLGAAGLEALSHAASLGAMRVLSAVLALAGAVALARQRTWGLFAVVIAGLALLAPFAGMSSSRGCGGGFGTVDAMVALVLLTAALPFAGPAFRFLRAR
jgi:hypothetical protein